MTLLLFTVNFSVVPVSSRIPVQALSYGIYEADQVA
jgi:hypothetical protein